MMSLVRSLILLLSLSLSLLAKAASPFDQSIDAPHEIQLLEDNIAALEARLQLIENAEEFILAETLTWGTDHAGRILARALVDKKIKNPQVDIRLLIDSTPGTPQFTPHIAGLFKQYGIEVKFYNDQSVVNVNAVNHRNHRKLFQSEKEFITGGRNVANHYFSLAKTSNFIDRDVLVRGPIDAAVKNSFFEFWNSPHSLVVAAPEIPVPGDFHVHQDSNNPIDLPGWKRAVAEWHAKMLDARKFMLTSMSSDEDQELFPRFRKSGKTALGQLPVHRVSKIRFVSDKPSWDSDSDAVTGNAIEKLISSAGERVIIENGYIIPDSKSWRVYRKLLLDGKQILFLTNSRAAAREEFLPNAMTLNETNQLLREGARVFRYSGLPMPSHPNPATERTSQSMYNTHAKTVVIDDGTCIVGTANFDPRSLRRMNSEMALVFSDPAFCAHVFESISARMKNSIEAKADEQDRPEDNVRSFGERTKLLSLPIMRKFLKRWF